MPAPPTDLAERYGAPRASARRAGLTAVAMLVAVAGAWLVWVVLASSSPEVRSELLGWEAGDDGSVAVRLQVEVDDGVVATCRVRAISEEHTVVGELAFEVTDDDLDAAGRLSRDLRVERSATAVEHLGCTSPGQSRPR